MSKLKYLAKNTLIFGISQFSSKVIVFLLLPLYTSYMTTSDYGSADLIVSTIGLLLPIFTMQMSSAVMRFAIDEKTAIASLRKAVFNTNLNQLMKNKQRYYFTSSSISLTIKRTMRSLQPYFSPTTSATHRTLFPSATNRL